jgi:hypothetical protein
MPEEVYSSSSASSGRRENDPKSSNLFLVETFIPAFFLYLFVIF